MTYRLFGDVCPFFLAKSLRVSRSSLSVRRVVVRVVCQLVLRRYFFSLWHLWPMGVPIGGTCYRDESRVATDSGDARAAAAAAPATAAAAAAEATPCNHHGRRQQTSTCGTKTHSQRGRAMTLQGG